MRETSPHHVYLIPGLFGFGKLAGYDYFEHVTRALGKRFDRAGVPVLVHVVSAPPTASITVRARVLLAEVKKTALQDDGPIHVVGHSTGGLDARLLLDPTTHLGVTDADLAWRSRVQSVVCMNTPHYGTPLAAYFTTAAGTRLLYLLSLFTVTTLSLGRLPLSIFANVVAAISGIERRLALGLKPIDELTQQVLRFVDAQGRAQIGDYLERVHSDQAGIIQLMPEVMELFNDAVHDNPAVRYGCVVSAAPAPGPRSVLQTFGSPWAAAQLGIYTTVFGITSHASERYAYALPTAAQAGVLGRSWPSGVSIEQVDGIVPTRSMLWGELLWSGAADHLDIVGHFHDGLSPRMHVDWLRSGAGFSRANFGAMLDAVCKFMLRT